MYLSSKNSAIETAANSLLAPKHPSNTFQHPKCVFGMLPSCWGCRVASLQIHVCPFIWFGGTTTFPRMRRSWNTVPRVCHAHKMIPCMLHYVMHVPGADHLPTPHDVMHVLGVNHVPPHAQSLEHGASHVQRTYHDSTHDT